MTTAEDILNKFQRRADDTSSMQYLSFRKGSWEYGVDKNELEPETALVIDMMTAARGWVCWADGQVVEELVTPILEGDPPSEQDLPDHSDKFMDPQKDGWSKQDILLMRELEGERLQFKFKGGSQGVQKAVAALCEDYIKEAKAQNSVDILPVVTLETDSYRHKTYGKIPTPVFKIQSWMTRDEVNAHFHVPETAKVEKEPEAKKLERK